MIAVSISLHSSFILCFRIGRTNTVLYWKFIFQQSFRGEYTFFMNKRFLVHIYLHVYLYIYACMWADLCFVPLLNIDQCICQPTPENRHTFDWLTSCVAVESVQLLDYQSPIVWMLLCISFRSVLNPCMSGCVIVDSTYYHSDILIPKQLPISFWYLHAWLHINRHI